MIGSDWLRIRARVMVLFLSYNYLLESSVFLYRPSAFPVFFMLVLNESLYYMYTDATRVEEG